jgi:hypothetical protein
MNFITMLLMSSNYKIQQTKIINTAAPQMFVSYALFMFQCIYYEVIQSFKFKLCL